MLKQLLFFFCKFYDFFCRRHSLMNRPCYNNLFQIRQHDNFRNVNRVFLISENNLEFRVNGIWYCFKVIKQCAFHYLMKSVPITGKLSSFEILHLFDTLHYQSLVILFLVLLWLWSIRNQMVFVLYGATTQLSVEVDSKLASLLAIIFPYLAKFIKHINTQ